MSDHLPIFFVCKLKERISYNSTSLTVRKRLFSDENINNLLVALYDTDWVNIYDTLDPNEAYNIFLDTFMLLYDKYCPVQNIKLNTNRKDVTRMDKAWITSALKNSCRKKNLLYKQFPKSKTFESEQRYKIYKNKLISILRNVKVRYYEQLLEQNKTDIKKTWKILNTLTSRVRRKCNYPEEFKLNDIFIRGNQNIANKFNEYFVNVGPSLAAKIPNCGRPFDSYMADRAENTMFLSPTSEQEIISLVNNMKSKSSTDCNDINMFLVKMIVNAIVTPLTYIFNLSLQKGVFPDQLKVTLVTPLYKSGDSQLFSNYRPVSLLPQFSKILEKIVNNRLKLYIEHKSILSKCQYGFRRGHSTSLALLELVEKISTATDNSMFTIGVFVDLKKAFDTLNHTILLRKLEIYGIRGVVQNWLADYLTNRTQYVNINGICSDKRLKTCGVPQGSVLGPTLFLLYINDICNVSKIFNIILFADDTNLFHTGLDIKTMCQTISYELSEINKWFQANKLSLNVLKTNYIIFGNRRKLNENYNICIDDISLDRTFVTKFLGVYLDSKLNWGDHIKIIKQKIAKNIGIINKVKNMLNRQTLNTLYSTLISPYLYYCCEIWGNTFKTRIKSLIILQKRALRVINKVGFTDHALPLFKKCNILVLVDLIKFNTLCIMYKAKHDMLP